jgi:DNA-binding transcriptional ArsR family regulator
VRIYGVDLSQLLVHPVRLRIIHAMSGGRAVTTSQLCERMPDVSKATVYRHVSLLADGGILAVDGEQRVHGAVERRYRLRRERAVIDADTAASASLDDHRHAFAAAMASLSAEFNAYLDRDQADPTSDLVGYRQHAIWLSPAERADLIEKMRAAILPHIGHAPSPERQQHLISPILFPIEGPAEEASDPGSGQTPGEPGS